MSFVNDNEQCIDCRLCIAECPDGGISVQFGKKGSYGNSGKYKIDENKCTECIEYNRQSKCAYVCPVDCIELKNPEPEDVLWAKWKKIKNQSLNCPICWTIFRKNVRFNRHFNLVLTTRNELKMPDYEASVLPTKLYQQKLGEIVVALESVETPLFMAGPCIGRLWQVFRCSIVVSTTTSYFGYIKK